MNDETIDGHEILQSSIITQKKQFVLTSQIIQKHCTISIWTKMLNSLHTNILEKNFQIKHDHLLKEDFAILGTIANNCKQENEFS